MRTPRQILADAHTIAVVGASRDPQKPAHWVPQMLQDQGWRVIPVNPHAEQIFGERAYGRLSDIPWHVDVVEVFRPSGEAPEIAEAAVAAGAGAVWLQQGVTSPRARSIAEDAGLDYVEDTCMGMERALHDMTHLCEHPTCQVYHGVDPAPEVPQA
ncbi:CoA-binding protein [Dactylosporangium darangshiense]|uniref:CoA-binding protein n=1 Tax=Dactylosporangium darangshiense TaxID=579108 RepID=A0ABP8CYS0_9ACTN